MISEFISLIGLQKLLQILLILASSFILNTVLRKLIRLPQKLETKRAKTLLSLTQSLISIIIFTLGITFILTTLEVDITPLLASAGIAGIAIGFGSQALVKDVIAGLFLLAEDSISIGDLVKIGPNRGIVSRISLRTVILKDDNGSLIIIPAGQIKEVINLSKEDVIVNIDLPLKSNLKIDPILKLLREELTALTEDKRYQNWLTKKPLIKGIEEIQVGQLIVRATLHTKAHLQWNLKREFLLRVKRRFEKEKIDLA